MCFSAEASFIVGSAAGVVGLASLRVSHRWPLVLFALIPLFFMFQQWAEGVVWLYMGEDFHRTFFSGLATNIYLFFALVFWPFYLPFSMAMWETDPLRKKLCLGLLALGVLIGIWNLTELVSGEMAPQVVGSSLHYGEGISFYRVIYGFVVFAPLFISSVSGIRLLGILGVISFVVAHFLFGVVFISVWCFFAALISLMIYKIIRDLEKRPLAGKKDTH